MLRLRAIQLQHLSILHIYIFRTAIYRNLCNGFLLHNEAFCAFYPLMCCPILILLEGFAQIQPKHQAIRTLQHIDKVNLIFRYLLHARFQTIQQLALGVIQFQNQCILLRSCQKQLIITCLFQRKNAVFGIDGKGLQCLCLAILLCGIECILAAIGKIRHTILRDTENRNLALPICTRSGNGIPRIVHLYGTKNNLIPAVKPRG